jgi:hypothetical protein
MDKEASQYINLQVDKWGQFVSQDFDNDKFLEDLLNNSQLLLY